MNNNDFNKIKDELTQQLEKNNQDINLYDERMRMSRLNKFDSKFIKAGSFMMFSNMFILSFLYISIYVLRFLFFIPAFCFPLISIPTSIGLGLLFNHLLNKHFKVKERIKAFSKAKTESEKLEEEVIYTIELAKVENRNKVINSTIENLSSKISLLNNLSTKYNISDKNEPKNYEEAKEYLNKIEIILKDNYDELDILSTQKTLTEKFEDIRSKADRFNLVFMTAITTLIVPGLLLYCNFFPLTQILHGSLFGVFAIVSSPLLSSLISIIYSHKKIKEYTKVFNTLNDKLGDDALPLLIKSFNNEESQELNVSLEKKINAITQINIEYYEKKLYLESLTPSDDTKNNIKKSKTPVIETDIPVIDNSLEKGPSLTKGKPFRL